MNKNQLKTTSCEEFLKESLEEKAAGKVKQGKVKQNYMELGMVYFCRANDQPFERCIHYSPTPAGNCTFRFDKFCRKEESRDV